MTKEAMKEALQGVPIERRLAVVFALRVDLKQKHIADLAGMRDPLFSRTVTNQRAATPNERRAIAKAVGLSVSDLFGHEVSA